MKRLVSKTSKGSHAVPIDRIAAAEEDARVTGFMNATKSLTLSSTLIEKYPNILKWQVDQVCMWLDEVFTGFPDLELYKSSFRKLGINGIDLLGGKESLFTQCGITHQLHIDRAKTCVSQLILYQDRYNKEADIRLKEYEANKNFYDLEKKYNDIKKENAGRPYQFPSLFEKFSDLDVFAFLMLPENYDICQKFIKPLALKRLNGQELIELLELPKNSMSKSTDTKTSKVDLNKDATTTPTEIGKRKVNLTLKSKKLEFTDLDVDELELERFKELLQKSKKKYDDRYNILKKKRETDLNSNFRTYDPNRVRSTRKLGSGASGDAYLVEYEKKKYVRKVLKNSSDGGKKKLPTRNTASPAVVAAATATTTSSTATTKNSPQSDNNGKAQADGSENVEEIKSKKLKDDTLYEARMLVKASGTGVVKLEYVDLDSEEPGMLLEFMVNQSVETALQLADSDKSSIFHPENPLNLEEKKNGNPDPVLFHMVRIARDVASALSRLHLKQIVHLDIAARNIFLDALKRPKIGDFGCAVMENDMIELQEWCRKKVEEENIDPKDLKEEYEEVENESNDENAARKFRMYKLQKRPTRWFPDYYYKSHYPRVDSHIDCYSFGCFMLEMATRKIPHDGKSDDEVMQLKLNNRGTPSIPPKLDDRYAAIMTACWTDPNLTMDTVSTELTNLHRALNKECSVNGMRDRFIETKLPSFSNYDNINPSSTSNYGASNFADAAERAKNITSQDPLYHFYPDVTECIIKIKIPSNMDMDEVYAVAEYNLSGILKVTFSQLIESFYCIRQTHSLSKYLQTIKVESDDNQVNMICLCLEYLQILAEDIHSDADDEKAWIGTHNAIMFILSEINQAAIEPIYRNQVAYHAFAAFGALLKRATDESIVEAKSEIRNFESNITTMISVNLDKYKTNEKIIKAVAVIFSAGVAKCPSIVDELYLSGALGNFVKVIFDFIDNKGTLLECIDAIGRFQIEQLIFLCPSQPQDENLGGIYDCIIAVISHYFNLFTNQGGSHFQDIIQECLLMIYRSCQSSLLEPLYIERLFVFVSEYSIDLLYKVIVTFPDHFRIQEASIGILAHIINTGKISPKEMFDGTPVISYMDKMNLSKFVSGPDRLKKLLELDPNLDKFLLAMGKFKINDNITKSIQKSSADVMTDTSVRYGIYTATATKTSSVYQSKTISLSKTDMDQFEGYSEESIEEISTALGLIVAFVEFDKHGDQITAASLQKNVAIIIGVACFRNKDVQTNLVRTQYNEYIITAFKNFFMDVDLIRFGCHALYSTCHGNLRHQRILYGLNIVKHVWYCLVHHKDEAVIVDGVICALKGLIEPSTSLRSSTTYNEDKKFILKIVENMIACSSNKSQDDHHRSLLDYITSYVTNFMLDSNGHAIVSNFFQLISTIAFWVPNILSLWLLRFANLSSSKRFRFLLNFSVWKQRMNEVLNVSAAEHNVSTLKALKNNSGDMESCDLLTYTLTSMEPHSSSPHLLASALAIITALFRQFIPPDFQLGNEIKYSFAPDADNESKVLFIIRYEAVRKGILQYCLQAAKLSSGHAILIRYSLWMLIIIISEVNDDKSYSSVVDNEGLKSVKEIASDIVLHGGVLWASEIIKEFKDFYSLQSLAAVFLIWMERHGHLGNKPLAFLRELKELLSQNLSRSVESYLPLQEEGHDVYLMTEKRELFGNLHRHCEVLIRSIDGHLGYVKFESKTVWDGRLLPLSVSVSACDNMEDPITLKRIAIFDVTVIWDEIHSIEREFGKEKQTNQSKQVKTSLSLKYEEFLEIQKLLMNEFAHLNLGLENIQLKPTSMSDQVAKALNFDDFQEKRRLILHNWITKVTAFPVVLFSKHFRSFLRHDEKIISLPKIQFIAPMSMPVGNHPVKCIEYDILYGFIFVGTGSPNHLFCNNKLHLGALFVFKLTDRHYLKPLCSKEFNSCVSHIQWDISRRCVIVGLRNGIINFYSLSIDGTSLEYVSELDYHRDNFRNLVFDSMTMLLAAVSKSGKVTLSSMVDGKCVTQAASLSREKLSAMAYDRDIKVAFCGTVTGNVLVVDLRKNPCSVIISFSVSDKNPISYLAFEECCRILFVACHNHVNLYRVRGKPRTSDPKEREFSSYEKISTLSLRDSCVVCNILLIEKVKFIVVSTSDGNIAVFSFPSLSLSRSSSPSNSPTKVSSSSWTNESSFLSAGLSENTSLTESKVLSAREVMMLSKSSMRDWLRAKGRQQDDLIILRDLIRAVAKVDNPKKDIEEVADMVSPPDLNQQPIVLLAWTLESSVEKSSRDFIRCSCYIEDIQSIAFGCQDGRIYMVSLDDIIECSDRKLELDNILRTQTMHETPPISPGSKSSRGKRSQLS